MSSILYQLGPIVGAVIAVAVPSWSGALALALIAEGAKESIRRQPAARPEIFRTMLIMQATASGPAIFGLVIGLIVFFTKPQMMSGGVPWSQIGAGLAMGIGAWSTSLGCGRIGYAAVQGVARQPRLYRGILLNSLISQAICQTTAILAFVVAMMLAFKGSPEGFTGIARGIGSGLCAGIGAVGPGIATGRVGEQAIHSMSQNSGSINKILQVNMTGMAVTQSTGIYAAVIALLIVFVIK
ncbi:ATP synthase F0 subunit C [bacterium]|nr:ATP synthase F0 subunit C [candidate division CSSED10-310 bacterium]